jgi:hypothetical protein
MSPTEGTEIHDSKCQQTVTPGYDVTVSHVNSPFQLLLA